MARQMVSSPVLAISLIGGAMLNIWSDHLEAGGPAFALRDLTHAGAVTLPAGPRGQPERAAVGVWNRRGHYAVFVPANAADAGRAVEAIYQARPDLRALGLPRDLQASLPRALARATTLGDPHERLVAGLSHLSVLFFPLVLPLIFWLAYAHRSSYVARQARQAFIFHLSIVVVDGLIVVALIFTSAGSLAGLAAGHLGSLGLGLLALLVGGLILVALTLFGLACSLYAAIQTFQGRPFTYPFFRRR